VHCDNTKPLPLEISLNLKKIKAFWLLLTSDRGGIGIIKGLAP